MERNNPTCCATFLARPECVEVMQATMDCWITWELPTKRILTTYSHPAQLKGQKWECKKSNGMPHWLHWTSGEPSRPELFQIIATLWSTGWLQDSCLGGRDLLLTVWSNVLHQLPGHIPMEVSGSHSTKWPQFVLRISFWSKEMDEKSQMLLSCIEWGLREMVYLRTSSKF